MTEFEQQVIENQAATLDRLARLETLVSNGLTEKVAEVRAWITTHPAKCPITMRRTIYTRPVLVAVLTAAAIKLADWVPSVIGWIKP